MTAHPLDNDSPGHKRLIHAIGYRVAESPSKGLSEHLTETKGSTRRVVRGEGGGSNMVLIRELQSKGMSADLKRF
jgi:hypothetical protein